MKLNDIGTQQTVYNVRNSISFKSSNMKFSLRVTIGLPYSHLAKTNSKTKKKTKIRQTGKATAFQSFEWLKTIRKSEKVSQCFGM